METNASSWKYVSVAAAAWACHCVSLWGSFVFDDSEAIVKNKDVMPQTSLRTVFRNDFWGTNIALNSSHKSYRPLTVLSYRLNIFFSNNRLDAFQFHTANVVLHGILSIMALPFFEILLRRKSTKRVLPPLDDPAFTAALLFATHPIHCEAVAALVGRADLLAALLFLWLLILYRALLQGSSLLWFLVVLSVTGSAVLCKESAITVLGMCVVFEICLNKKLNKSWQTYLLNPRLLCRLGVLVFIGGIIMFLRLWVMDFEGPTFSHTDNPAAFAENFFVRLFSHSYVYLLNALLLVWPQWLCFDWSMGCVPLIQSPWDFRAYAVLLFWLLCVFAVVVLFKNCVEKGIIDVAVIGVCLVLLPFLPASNLLFPVGFVLAERTLLLPSAGYCFLVTVGLQKLKDRYCGYKHLLSAFYILLCVTFTLRCVHRNYEWLNEERLFKSALLVCPLNAKVHYNIAKVAADAGHRHEALTGYRYALEVYPDYEQAMNNLANLLREEGKSDEAEKLLKRAVQVRPNFAAAWMNLGIVLSGRGAAAEAEVAYRTALRHRARHPDAHYNLGNLLLDMGRHQEALAAWMEASRLRPGHAAAWGNALALLDSSGRAAEAVELGRAALHSVPRAPAVHFALGNALGKLQRFHEAEAHFLQAIRFNQSNALYYSNLGVLYHRWEKPEKARQMYLKALKMDPNLKSADVNLKKLEANFATNAHSIKLSYT